MRSCPNCQVDFQILHTRFAEVDVCPSCRGVFLDPGEGVAMFGADGDGSFLVKDGRAKFSRISSRICPVKEHPQALMRTHVMSVKARSVEFEYCATCHGVFLDDGEGALLQALDALDPSEVVAASGARFAGPPAGLDAASTAADQVRKERGKSLFAAFFTDVLEWTSRAVVDEVTRGNRRARYFGRR